MKQNARKATTYHLPMQRGVYIMWGPLWNQIHTKLQLEGPLTILSLSYFFSEFSDFISYAFCVWVDSFGHKI